MSSNSAAKELTICSEVQTQGGGCRPRGTGPDRAPWSLCWFFLATQPQSGEAETGGPALTLTSTQETPPSVREAAGWWGRASCGTSPKPRALGRCARQGQTWNCHLGQVLPGRPVI